jgi:hypothetical protein
MMHVSLAMINDISYTMSVSTHMRHGFINVYIKILKLFSTVHKQQFSLNGSSHSLFKLHYAFYQNKDNLQIFKNLATMKSTIFNHPKLDSKQSPGYLEHTVSILVIKNLRSIYKKHKHYLPQFLDFKKH